MDKRTFLLGSVSTSLLGLAACGGGESFEDSHVGDASAFEPPSVSGSGTMSAVSNKKSALAWANEVEAIVNYTHRPTWVYYTDRTSFRWYISPIDLYNTASGIYSLGPLVNGQASWWTVATEAITGSSLLNTLTIRSIVDNLASDVFYDIGRRTNVTDPQIHRDRSLISSSTVPAKWYFFSAPNGRWYIIADPSYGSTNPPIIRRFDALNGNYNWVPVDTTGVRAIFQWSLGTLTIRLSRISEYASTNEGQSRDMDGYYGSQCVDLMHHYIDSALGIPFPHGFTGNAYALYLAAANSTTKTSWRYGTVVFSKIANTVNAIPSPGDIVFWSSPDPGHVAIVIDANSTQFTSIDQNWINSSATVGSPAAIVQHSYRNVVGWLSPTW